MADKKLVITEYRDSITCFLMENLRAQSIFVDANNSVTVNSIYVGKVKNIKKDINAAFVEIAEGVMGFLPLDEYVPSSVLNRVTDSDLHENDDILVMVQKEAVKTKLVSLTTKLNIPGILCVACCDKEGIFISSKLDKITSNDLYNKLKADLDLKGLGLIVRTNGALAEYSLLLEEAKRMIDVLADILSVKNYRTVFSVLYKSKPVYITRIEDLPYNEYSEIITDTASVYNDLIKYLPNLSDRVRLYKDDSLSLKALYSLERAVSEATDKKINLNSGGFLVIEPTEAMTVIDVNSGKLQINKDKDAAVDKVNKEAAKEIARQLRLRNIYGIIIVDFINYKNKEAAKELFSYLRNCLKDDDTECKAVDVTALGLIEITRAKKYGSIYDYKKVFDK